MKQYNVGDKVWYARVGMREVSMPCPVCYGKLAVTLILGNDNTVVLPCTFCAPGYSEPSGTITEYEWKAEPEEQAITGVNITINGNKEEREYRSNSYILYSEDVFSAREEALVRCEERIKQHEIEESTRVEHLKANAKKSFSWNAGYHLRQVKDHKKQMEYHERKAILCKARSKEDI
jgi:hypothetical protein